MHLVRVPEANFGRVMPIRSAVTIPLVELAMGGRKNVVVDGIEITLIRRESGVIALRNQCPHANGRVGDGAIAGDSIECPLHKWKFDLATGATKRDRKLKATLYPARIEGDLVVIEFGVGPLDLESNRC